MSFAEAPEASKKGKNAANVSKIDEYCRAMGGTKPIHSVLICNNGIAAVKFIRSVRSWAYETFGDERAVLLVAMATPEDMRVNAEHIRMADQFVEVPGGTNNNNYANVQLIVEVAERTGVDAVWPGWGHASENPDLPESLARTTRGIGFLGPPAGPMAALGDKIGSSIIAQAAGVPTIPWSGSKVNLSFDKCCDPIPDDIYRAACVQTAEEAATVCQEVGYPCMIKASWGGGGKGIRKVHNDEEVRALFKQVQGEVPGSPIFIMKLASQSRHLEVQLLCDQYGNVAALHSRDCSIQRRHQKIIEEGPITVAPPDIVEQLEQAACRLAKAVSYVGAATVEYLYSSAENAYYFLELNPRLQVEHPVTEWIAGVNLPASQLNVGMGIPLWKLPEIRKLYGQPFGGNHDMWRESAEKGTPFEFTISEKKPPKGHVVAVRVTSEDPDDGFKPTSGKIQELSFRSKPDVWAYFSVKSGGGIHEYSDSQFGHLFAFGEHRAAACANMVLALKEVVIRGEIRTNVDYAIDIIKSEDFQTNRFHTGWLDSRIAMRVRTERPRWHISVLGGAVYVGTMTCAARVSEYIGYLTKGQIPPKSISLVNFQVKLNIESIKYTVDVSKLAPDSYRLILNNSEVRAEAHTLRDGGLLVQLDGNSHVVYAEEEANGTRLLIDGRTCLLQNDHDPSKLVAETPCKLLRFLVEDGGHVKADVAYAEVEVMKMCMPLLAPASGTIHFRMTEGQAMVSGDLIANLDLDDPSAVKTAVPFEGSLPELGTPTPVSDRVHHRYADGMNAAHMVLNGYEHDIAQVVNTLLKCLEDPSLPHLQWQEAMAVLSARLPKDLKAQLDSIWKGFEQNGSPAPDFPAGDLKTALEEYLEAAPEKDKLSLSALIRPLQDLAEAHSGGKAGHSRTVLKQLFEEYLAVEELFSENTHADVIEELRQRHKQQLAKVVDVVLSHQGIKHKNKLVLQLLNTMVAPSPSLYRDYLLRLSALSHSSQSEVALRCSQLLEQTQFRELRATIARNLSDLDLQKSADKQETLSTKSSSSLLHKSSSVDLDERMDALVDAPLPVEDALAALFDHNDQTLQERAIETYIRRLYQPYLVKNSFRIISESSALIATWRFWEENPPPSSSTLSKAPALRITPRGVQRWGAMVLAPTIESVTPAVASAMDYCAETKGEEGGGLMRSRSSTMVGAPSGSGNMLHVAIIAPKEELGGAAVSDDARADARVVEISDFLNYETTGPAVHSAGVELVSCLVQRGEGTPPARHCFAWDESLDLFKEQPLLRHVEPPLSNLLELGRLRTVQSVRYAASRDRQWHMYSTTDQKTGARRMFLRALVRQPVSLDTPGSQPGSPAGSTGDLSSPFAQGSAGSPASLLGSVNGLHGEEEKKPTVAAAEGLQRAIQGALEELELAAHDSAGRADHVHLFMCLLRAIMVPEKLTETPNGVFNFIHELATEIDKKLGLQMHKLGVAVWEVRLRISNAGKGNGAWRAVVSNPSGHACVVEIYREAIDPLKAEAVYLSPLSPPQGTLHGLSLAETYRPLDVVEKRRLAARRNGTTFCYDFGLVFEAALASLWHASPGSKTEPPYLESAELAWPEDTPGGWGVPLVETKRGPAKNNVGMVAWKYRMRTPEYPEGREVIIVANDCTFGAGAFGVREDAVFEAATELACKNHLPLIYLAANSGARIGVAEEVKAAFKVGWIEEKKPDKGFQYLYFTPEDYSRLQASVKAEPITLANGETHYIITDVIGKEDALGVENLSGSGAIASAYAKAYRETFTLTFVSGRTVGIGAYLARLGQRCIQRLDQPIILTGFSALNKLLGREVYTSHMQLGGPRIMACNGVVHATVGDDFEGCTAILKWLSYVPKVIGDVVPPSLKCVDPVDRVVEYAPELACDPRAAIRGLQVNPPSGPPAWLGGIFDQGSFTECLEGWAQTVVTGRARLGGWAVGVVAVETQTVMLDIPADPGQPDTHERVVPQAGQVWFPDSAAKTAQAIQDFNQEGLPLFILANWRGFSGGQRDLFEGVLQAGSRIVEHLRTYKHPAFVYIPKTGELRGGAWVVVDQRINSEMVEMYAEPTARGGVLEPEGMVEIKYRMHHLVQTMHRLDPELVKLDKEVADGRDKASVQLKVKERERLLLPIYKQIALKFADLHDTPQRMAAKKVIQGVVPWGEARRFFYRRLTCRLAQESLISQVLAASPPGTPRSTAKFLMRSWFAGSAPGGSHPPKEGGSTPEEDELFVKWVEESRDVVEQKLRALREETVAKQILTLANGREGQSGVLKGLVEMIASERGLADQQKLAKQLKDAIDQAMAKPTSFSFV